MFGEVREVPFHAVYILFSLIAAMAMWSLAKRWSPDPLAATLLFLVVPAFIVNGIRWKRICRFLRSGWQGSHFSWLAVFGSRRCALALAAMTAYQAVIATPILLVYCWMHARRSRAGWLVAFTPVLTVAAYQTFEKLHERRAAGHRSCGLLQRVRTTADREQTSQRRRADGAHRLDSVPRGGGSGVPEPLACRHSGRSGGGVHRFEPAVLGLICGRRVVIAGCIRRDFDFLACLVPCCFSQPHWSSFLRAPLVICCRWRLPLRFWSLGKVPRLVYPAIVANLLLGVALAVVNYQHWDGYRQFAAGIAKDVHSRRVWIDGEWGLRYYLEREGALPLSTGQAVQPGEWVVSSALAFPIPITAPLALVKEQVIRPSLPFRLIGLDSRSGYSTASLGLRPFDIF